MTTFMLSTNGETKTCIAMKALAQVPSAWVTTRTLFRTTLALVPAVIIDAHLPAAAAKGEHTIPPSLLDQAISTAGESRKEPHDAGASPGITGTVARRAGCGPAG